jgi:trehalose-phosphatase
MTTSLWRDLDGMNRGYRMGTPLALFFDFDGTLAPIVAFPWLARIDPRAAECLRRLADLPGVTVAILSGRSLDDLVPRVGLDNVHYAGTTGLEIQSPGSRRVLHPRARQAADLAREVASRLRPLEHRFPGAWIEEKPLGLTLHYRQAPADQHAALHQLAVKRLRPFAHSVRLVDGSCALEVTPQLGWDKGTALRMLLETRVPGGLPFMAGDDLNDGDAFVAAQELGGIALAVGPRAPHQARHRLPHCQAFWDVLETWTDQLETIHSVACAAAR